MERSVHNQQDGFHCARQSSFPLTVVTKKIHTIFCLVWIHHPLSMSSPHSQCEGQKKVFSDLDKTIFSNESNVYKHNKGILIVDDFWMKKMTKLNTYIV